MFSNVLHLGVSWLLLVRFHRVTASQNWFLVLDTGRQCNVPLYRSRKERWTHSLAHTFSPHLDVQTKTNVVELMTLALF